MSDPLEVAAGVIVDAAGRYLIAQRPSHLHQGGYWEFPGGKLEPGETSYQALVRELQEELDIRVEHAEPLIAVTHDYPDRRVRLDVWRVDAFSGEPRGLLGQPIRWVTREALTDYPFPAANQPIVAAARLPDRYAILNLVAPDPALLLAQLEDYHQAGIRLVRLRAPGLDPAAYRALAARAADACRDRGMDLMLSGVAETVTAVGAAGLHLRSDQLMCLTARPLDGSHWVAASCHDPEQLVRAAAMGVDFVVLGPVAPTATHPGMSPLGWARFGAWVADARLPVFALGGLGPEQLPLARQHGAQGIAAIRGFAHPKGA